MIIAILNCIAMLFCVTASDNKSWPDILMRLSLMLLAIYNGFEAYRFYIMGA